MKHCILLTVVAGICMTWVQSQSADKCTNTHTMKITMKSRLNTTGQDAYQVYLQQEIKEGQRPWTVEVEQSRVDCSGVDHLLTTATITAPSGRVVPAGYELLEGVGYFKLHTSKKTWSDAKKTCALEGGHLAIVNSQAEFAFLMKMKDRYTPQEIGHEWFVGLHDMHVEGNFVTIFGEPLCSTGFTKWCPNQPDNSAGKENCGCLLRDCGLNDTNCDSPSGFFCEQELE